MVICDKCNTQVERSDWESHAVDCVRNSKQGLKELHSITMTVQDKDGDQDQIKGVIKSFDFDNITVYHEEGGEATFPRHEMIKTIIGKKRHSAPKPIKRPEPEVITKPKVAKKPRTNDGPSKLDMVVDLYAKHQEKSRKECIALIVEEIGMTPAGASTYYSLAKKQPK